MQNQFQFRLVETFFFFFSILVTNKRQLIGHGIGQTELEQSLARRMCERVEILVIRLSRKIASKAALRRSPRRLEEAATG